MLSEWKVFLADSSHRLKMFCGWNLFVYLVGCWWCRWVIYRAQSWFLKDKKKVLLLGTKNDRHESCISHLVGKTRAHFLPEFVIWIIKVNNHYWTLQIKKKKKKKAVCRCPRELSPKFKLATRLVLPAEKVIQIAWGLSCGGGIYVTIPTSPVMWNRQSFTKSPGLHKTSSAEITLLRKRKEIRQSKSKTGKR